MSVKKYLTKNVYEAATERIDFIFKNFEKIYVSFSGGKDSSIVLNLVIDYMKRHNITKKIGVLFIDLEGQYKITIDYIKYMLNKNSEYLDVYWCCLPLNLRNSLSVFQPFWTPWDMQNRDKWIREYPDFPDIITEENCRFKWFKKNMEFEEFIDYFGEWYAGSKKTACLVGIRSDESFNRFRTIAVVNKTMLSNLNWTTKVTKDKKLYGCYPIYDWKDRDIWIANYKFNWDYNGLYDTFYKAGLALSQMRICQPYGDDQRIGLNLFRIIEPETWAKVVNRVSGANFGNIYCGTKLLGYKGVTLPKGHTWESYTKMLLKTLPKAMSRSYGVKFGKFMKYWREVGSPIDISQMPEGATLSGKLSTRGHKNVPLVIYKRIPDKLPFWAESKKLGPSWRRMAICILKNDMLCRSLSFSQTKSQRERMEVLLDKYSFSFRMLDRRKDEKRKPRV
jgi:predicted phosphoadenosine phosphosulfate sulfurtransferase